MASLNPLQGNLGQRRAAHLLRRTSFRYTKSKVDQLATMSATDAVASLLSFSAPQLNQPIYDNTATPTVESTTWINPPGLPLPDQEFRLQYRVTAWWLNEALHEPGIGYKMIFFYHQYLAVTNLTIDNVKFFDYLSLLRWGALGNFKKLATKMIIDNTMLRYLSNNLNSKTNPNENFAREFLELFTIGKGPQAGPGDYTNYTEDDVIQAAKVLTGFQTRTQRDQVDPETSIPRGTVTFSRHDTSNKTFSHRFQNKVITGATTSAAFWTEINAFVDMVFNQDETARNWCRRIYRYFVHPNITPEIENEIIVPLANQLKSGGYEVLPVLQKLLASQHFYDADDSDNANEIIGGIIKSPLELVLQALSFFNITIPNPVTQNNDHYITFWTSGVSERMLGYANMLLFYPPDVAGYPAYHQQPDYNRQWFNSSSIIARYKLPQMLLTGKRVLGSSPNSSIGIKLNIAPWVKNSGVISDPSDPFVLVHELISYLLPEQIDTDRFDYFYFKIFLDDLPPADWTYEWQNYLSTNNETEVKIALERLIYHIMYSPEYQTF
ncbi:MAG: DUF1800 family protein [Saprospiraceae bacterium]|nr:DUF1800 family protein [Saprospiraceae bacterium]